LALPEVTEEEAFGPGINVYRVAGKVLATLQPAGQVPQVTLQCEPSLPKHVRTRLSGQL
jgi:predicted DNA-binding protein (MmcQ/YjbR family)